MFTLQELQFIDAILSTKGLALERALWTTASTVSEKLKTAIEEQEKILATSPAAASKGNY